MAIFPAYHQVGPHGKLNGENLTGVPTDSSIPVDAPFDGAMVRHLVSPFGRAADGGVPIYDPEVVSNDELGTQVSVTEYNWGALDDINGALAEADVLGISSP